MLVSILSPCFADLSTGFFTSAVTRTFPSHYNNIREAQLQQQKGGR